VIDGLDLWVQPGEWLAVMGASDVGKTTLCLLLAGLAPHLTGGRMEGRVTIAGDDTRQHPPPALAGLVGLLFQEPEAQLFNPTVEAEIAWGLENLGLPSDEIARRVGEMLSLFHLEAARHRAPGELSGGEKKRLALASVLAMQPALLILDEPMGGLDPAGREEVLAALSNLRRNNSTTIVMAESDPEAVAAFADRLVVLHRGRIALEGTPRALFQQVERLSALGVAVPQMAHLAAGLNHRLGTAFDFLTLEEARLALSSSLAGYTAEATGVAGLFADSSFPAYPAGPPPRSGIGVNLRRGRWETAPVGAERRSAPGRPPAQTEASTPVDAWPQAPEPNLTPVPRRGEGAEEGVPALETRQLCFWYRQGEPVLHGIDLSVPCGQFVALVGANGSGKTTLVKHFDGLLRPRQGQVRVLGRDTADRSVGELARWVGFLFQHPEQQIFGSSVRQEIAFGPRNLGLSPAEVEERVEAALARFGLSAVAGQPPAILGYGQRRRVTLASLAAMDPPILVLDEPTVGLDARGWQETLDWLVGLHAQGRTILLVTHDMALAARYAQRVVVLHQGRILADGSPARLFQQADLLAQASLTPPPVVALARALWPADPADECLTVEAFCARYTALFNRQAVPHHLPPGTGEAA